MFTFFLSPMIYFYIKQHFHKFSPLTSFRKPVSVKLPRWRYDFHSLAKHVNKLTNNTKDMVWGWGDMSEYNDKSACVCVCVCEETDVRVKRRSAPSYHIHQASLCWDSAQERLLGKFPLAIRDDKQQPLSRIHSSKNYCYVIVGWNIV